MRAFSFWILAPKPARERLRNDLGGRVVLDVLPEMLIRDGRPRNGPAAINIALAPRAPARQAG